MLSGFQFCHRTNGFATHQPVLFEAAMRSEGPILELGCGEGSTLLLHRISEAQNREVVSCETDAAWLGKYSGKYTSPLHQFRAIADWSALYTDDFMKIRWGVVFIDSAPWASRAMALQMLRNRATFIVIHDCDYFPENNIFGTVVKPRTGPGLKRMGERNYDDVFKSWREHQALEPWPYFLTGPPTLIGSSTADCTFDVDFSKY